MSPSVAILEASIARFEKGLQRRKKAFIANSVVFLLVTFTAYGSIFGERFEAARLLWFLIPVCLAGIFAFGSAYSSSWGEDPSTEPGESGHVSKKKFMDSIAIDVLKDRSLEELLLLRKLVEHKKHSLQNGRNSAKHMSQFCDVFMGWIDHYSKKFGLNHNPHESG